MPLLSGLRPLQRLRSYGYFLLAAVYFFFAKAVAVAAASGLASGDWFELVNRTILLFMLLVGYSGMGYAFQQQREPIKAMGLACRPGWGREFGIGVAMGWGMMVACVLPIAIFGGMVVTLWPTPRQLGWLVVDLAVLAAASLAEEVAFRGYPFQRLIESVGPSAATGFLAFLFGFIHVFNPGSTRVSTMVTVLSGIFLAVTYLRTRALWMAWGFHFAWNAAMGVLFGLPISGITNFSPVIQSNSMGPFWLTGDGYGPEASSVAVIVFIIGIVVMIRITRPYAWKYATPEIIPAGIPVDIDAAAKRQHEAASVDPGAPAASQLIQIAPVTSSSPVALPTLMAGQEPAPAPAVNGPAVTPIYADKPQPGAAAASELHASAEGSAVESSEDAK